MTRFDACFTAYTQHSSMPPPTDYPSAVRRGMPPGAGYVPAGVHSVLCSYSGWLQLPISGLRVCHKSVMSPGGDSIWLHIRSRIKYESSVYTACRTRKPSCRWQTRETRKYAKNCAIRLLDVLTTLSLTILAYLHSFCCCCVRNLQNPKRFSENSNLLSSRSSKVVDLGVNQKRICNFLLVINSNFGRIFYSFRDIDTFSYKIACFRYSTIVWRRLEEERLALSS